MSEAVTEFIAAMDAMGITPAENIHNDLQSGRLIRFDVKGDRPGRRNGWAVLHLDGVPAGAFGTNKGGISGKWRADAPERRLTAAERAAQRSRLRQAREDREKVIAAAQADVAVQAREMFAGATAADPRHPYVVRKNIGTEGIRQRGNMLLVPMADIDGAIWNVQRIFADGAKLFLKDGRTTGLTWMCGTPDAVICIGEGFGTMARVRKATGHTVVAAFSEKNLEPVAQLVRDRWPDLDLIICADDDAHLVGHPTIKRNLGLDAAHAAAAAVGGRVAVPPRGE